MNARNTSKDIKERVRKLVEKGGPLGKSLETTFKMMMWKNGLGYKDEEIEEDELEALKRKVESAWKGNPKFLEGSEGRYV